MIKTNYLCFRHQTDFPLQIYNNIFKNYYTPISIPNAKYNLALKQECVLENLYPSIYFFYSINIIVFTIDGFKIIIGRYFYTLYLDDIIKETKRMFLIK